MTQAKPAPLSPAAQSALRLASLAPDRWHEVHPSPILRRAVQRLATLGRVTLDADGKRFRLAPRLPN